VPWVITPAAITARFSKRVPKLFPELALARGDGRYARVLRSLTSAQLLILDDWGLEPLDAGARRDLYEILEERYGRRSTILTSQIPVDKMACLHWRADDLMMPPSSKELCVVLVFSTQRPPCSKG
jgi:IstB-like ATP binding protein